MLTVRDVLVAVAARGGTITYAELRAQLDLTGDIVPLLRALSEEEDDAGRGLLTAVVVRADTGRPGAGWFRLAAERGRDVEDADAAWEAERARLTHLHGG
ncbi:MAG TPA: hypothetical protein VHI95_11875 [Acidimicrobiales bacterium]|jgi:hypothetical protein|nr:hypothetical protein [Acidimicrobiales bacterium]